MFLRKVKVFIIFLSFLGLGITVYPENNDGGKTIYNQYPLPYYHKIERMKKKKEIKFYDFKSISFFFYDIEAKFREDQFKPFVVNHVFFNGKEIKKYRVLNNGQHNLLKKAFGNVPLSIIFYSNWRPDKKAVVKVIGTTMSGEKISLKVSQKTPSKRAQGTLFYRGFIPFGRPIYVFPYFRIRATFFPKQYKPFKIEKVIVNGRHIKNYRLMDSLYYFLSFTSYGKLEGIRNTEVYNNKIDNDNGFMMDIPLTWEKGEKLVLKVIGITKDGKTQTLTLRSNKAPWGTNFAKDNYKYVSIIVSEKAGMKRRKEPVEILLSLKRKDLVSPSNLRLVTYYRLGHDYENGKFVQVPFKVISYKKNNNSEYVNLKIVFPVDIESFEKRVFVLYYGKGVFNKRVEINNFQISKKSIKTKNFDCLFSEDGALDKIILKNGTKFEIKNRENFSRVENSFFKSEKINNIGLLKFKDKSEAYSSTYKFFYEKPYLIEKENRIIKKEGFVNYIPIDYLGLNLSDFDELLWRDIPGKIQSIDLTEKREVGGIILSLNENSRWVAFVNRKKKVVIAKILLYTKSFSYNPKSEGMYNFFNYVILNNQKIAHMRGVGYPLSNKSIFLRKGDVFTGKYALLILKYNNLEIAKEKIEKTDMLLRNPLQAELFYPPLEDSEAYPLVYLQGGKK